MKRKVFASVFVVSLLAALVIGAALAWTGFASGGYTSTAGSISVALYKVVPTGKQVYPTAIPIAVLTGGIKNNTSPNPGIAVRVRGGNAAGSVTPIDSFENCENWLSGDVVRLSPTLVSPGGFATGGLWQAWLQMAAACPDKCQGKNINYTVTVNVET